MTIDVDPIIGKLGPLEFRWYGVIMAIAVMVGVWVMSRQLKARGIDPEHALGIAVFGIPLGIIGARLVHVLDHLGYYIDNPGKIIGIRLVGLAIYGVVAGGLLGLILYCKWRKLSVWRVVDSTALAFPVSQIIGKCANIINGDTWGGATDLPWGITYTNPESFIDSRLLGVATHPTPIYEQIWLLVVVAALLLTMKRLRKVDGLAILSYVWLYSVGRFAISFWRENEEMLWGLNEAQVIAAVMIVLVPFVAYWRIRRARRQPVAAKSAAGKKHKEIDSKDGKPLVQKGESKAKAGKSAEAKAGFEGSKEEREDGPLKRFVRRVKVTIRGED